MVMEALDTAEPTTDTAAEVIEAPPETVQPESVSPEVPETEVAEASPETVETATEPEPAPSLVDQLSSLEREELTELGPIKDLLARNEESAQRKAQAETAKRLAAERQQWAQSGQFAQDLAATLSVDDENNPLVDTKKVSEITGDLVQVSFRNAVAMVGVEVDNLVPSDFTLTMEQKAKLEDASNAFMADSSTFSNLIQEWFDIVKRFAVDEATPGIEAKVRKAVAEEQETEVEAAETKAADETETPAPTNPNGAAPSGSRITNFTEAAAAYNAGAIDGATYAKFREQFGIH